MELRIYGYFGKGNLGDEAILEVWRRHLGGVEVLSPPRLPMGSGITLFTGGILQDRTSFRSLCYYSLAISIARRYGPVLLGAVGVDVRRGASKALLRAVLRGVDYISVRDRASAAALGELGFAPVEARDPALLLPSPPRREGEYILLNLVPSLPRGTVRRLIGEAEGISRSLGMPILGLVMARGEDREALRGFRLLIPRTPREALEILSRAALLIGARLHSLELALVAGCPFFPVPYSPKVGEFVSLVEREMPRPFPGEPDPEVLLSGEWATGLRRSLERLREEAAEGIRDVCRAVSTLS